jgi:hypothetical protein
MNRNMLLLKESCRIRIKDAPPDMGRWAGSLDRSFESC